MEPVYQPKHELSKLYIDHNGILHCDRWFCIDGIGGIERDFIVYNVYFLTYCL